MAYRVKIGKTLHVPGCREVRSGQPVPDQIAEICKSLGNLSGLLAAGYIEQFEPEQVVEVVVEQKRSVGRPPKFSQITDGASADKLISDHDAENKGGE